MAKAFKQASSPLRDKSFLFAVEIVRLSQRLSSEQKEYVLSRQILRSGTSIGANIRESTFAESKQDFIHKLSIAQKECEETIYWLELLFATGSITIDMNDALCSSAQEILRIITASIKTCKISVAKYNLPSKQINH